MSNGGVDNWKREDQPMQITIDGVVYAPVSDDRLEQLITNAASTDMEIALVELKKRRLPDAAP